MNIAHVQITCAAADFGLSAQQQARLPPATAMLRSAGTMWSLLTMQMCFRPARAAACLPPALAVTMYRFASA